MTATRDATSKRRVNMLGRKPLRLYLRSKVPRSVYRCLRVCTRLLRVVDAREDACAYNLFLCYRRHEAHGVLE